MADSKRLVVLKKMTDLLKGGLPIVDDPNHDWQDSVFRGRSEFGDEDPLPCVSIREDLDPDRGPSPVGTHGVVDKSQWILLVQGWVADDKDNPTDPAYNLMADVKKVLARIEKEGDPYYLLNDTVVGMRMEPGVCRSPDQFSSKAYFWMRVVLQFVEDKADPYKL